jgi:hypothetical protein
MSARVTSYSTLVSAVTEAAEDVGTELNEFLPVAIDLAETRLARELDFLGLVYTSTISVAASTPTFTKPNGHKLTHHVAYTDPNTARKTVLRKKSDDYIMEYWPQEASAGTPKYYADDDRTTIRIAPCTSATSNIEIRGVRRPTVLTSAAPTNVFTSVASDALFYATMIEVAIWQRNDALLNNYGQMYSAARDSINIEGSRQKRDDGSGQKALKGENTLPGTN